MLKKEDLKIGIDASRAFVDKKTGIEEYSYQLIKHFCLTLKDYQVILYLRPGDAKKIDFVLPKKWKMKELFWGYFWTQSGLSLELLFHPVNVLFVPAHTLPFIHPCCSYVTVHGLEFELSPESYSWKSKIFHRFFIKKSCHWANKIIAVSQKTRDDLIKLYNVDKKNIVIIPNGFDRVEKLGSKGRQKNNSEKISERFIFFLGRLEERKNIEGIIRAFEIFKKKYKYSGQLFLGGSPGYGYDKIKEKIEKSEYKSEIRELGFVDDRSKWSYLKKADIFLFPSFFEGFGIPILEAQSVGTPVITSKRSPMKNVAGDKRILVNPKNYLEIATKLNKILSNKNFRKTVIAKGLENVQQYSWLKTAEKISRLLIEEKC